MTPHEWRIALLWAMIGMFMGIVLWGCDDVSHNETRTSLPASSEVVSCGYTTFRIAPNGPRMWVDDYASTCQSGWMKESIPLFSLQKGDHGPAFIFMSGSVVYAASPRECVYPPPPAVHALVQDGPCPER